MITHLAHYETSLFWGWVLAMIVPTVVLLRLALWFDRIPPQNSVGAIRARIERERRAAAADMMRLRPVTGPQPARRPAHRRIAA
ncbi:hypothetical protein KHQ06_02345 [Nocardia tengchongensis]|uniref:Uncharacterized protein n=1 Tax=Nocardia tengchongensis TaxID=2055889 RepID=A0ABX8CQ48_9NOCA|nr:hypothetical protein [Nocardia tengchongensis]QVI22018.1 hypothetical protein KHQ06_02345 [Nocardia tengchongensis]